MRSVRAGRLIGVHADDIARLTDNTASPVAAIGHPSLEAKARALAGSANLTSASPEFVIDAYHRLWRHSLGGLRY